MHEFSVKLIENIIVWGVQGLLFLDSFGGVIDLEDPTDLFAILLELEWHCLLLLLSDLLVLLESLFVDHRCCNILLNFVIDTAEHALEESPLLCEVDIGLLFLFITFLLDFVLVHLKHVSYVAFHF